MAGSIVALWAVILCWAGVGWAFRAHPMLVQDEIGNLGWTLQVSYRQILRLFPAIIYNDRPTGFALERLLYDCYGFNYYPQLAWFLVFHAGICAMAFVLFRRLGLRLPLACAAVGAFGVLSTTAQTATYLAASFDVLCTFFLLASTLAIFAQRRWLWALSAVFYLLALRSKEFGIVIPVFLTALLVLLSAAGTPLVRRFLDAAKRLWPHYAILVIFAARYLWLARDMRVKLPAGSPYYMSFSPVTLAQSFGYYTALIFGAEEHSGAPVWTVLLIILAYALVRRRAMILAGFGIFALTLLPVSLLPNIHSPFYAYGPQLFLLFAVASFLQKVCDLACRGDNARWWAGVCIALAAMTALSFFRESPYYRARVHWSWMVRDVCGKSAASIQRQLANIGPAAHLYVNSGSTTPWLFAYGDCVYPRIVRHSQAVQCILGQPERQLQAAFALDPFEKYFADYALDGTLTVRPSAPAGAPHPLKACDPRLVDDQNPRVHYTGPWRALRSFGEACGKTLSYTDMPGAAVTLEFEGTSVTYLFTRAYTHGFAEVLIDGQRREVIDAFYPAIEWRAETTYSGLAPGRHTITVRAVHAKAAQSQSYDVDLDGFIVR